MTTPIAEDLVNRKTHPCGCETAFDLTAWASVALIRCYQHFTVVIDAYEKHLADNNLVVIERGSVPEWFEEPLLNDAPPGGDSDDA